MLFHESKKEVRISGNKESCSQKTGSQEDSKEDRKEEISFPIYFFNFLAGEEILQLSFAVFHLYKT